MGKCALAAIILCTSVACTASQGTGSSQPATDWPAYGGAPGGGHYSSASQIAPDNVARLKKAWVFESPDYRAAGEMTVQTLEGDKPSPPSGFPTHIDTSPLGRTGPRLATFRLRGCRFALRQSFGPERRKRVLRQRWPLPGHRNTVFFSEAHGSMGSFRYSGKGSRLDSVFVQKLECLGIAVNVAAMSIKHIEVDEVGENDRSVRCVF